MLCLQKNNEKVLRRKLKMSDHNQREDVNEKLTTWYENNVVDDREDNSTIAEVCIRDCRDRFNIDLGDVPTVLAIYAFTLDSITEQLRSMQDKLSEAEIHVDDIVAFGYDNLSDDDTEKQGNFSPYMFDLGGRLDYTRDPDSNSVDNCTKWMTMKLRDYPKMWDEIASRVLTNLSDICDIPISQSCIVLPIFAVIQSQLCKYMDVKRKDENKSEISITFAGCIDVFARKTEDNGSTVEFKPMPSTKLGIKSDAKATAAHEDED